jgi:hypothetical protein
VKTQDRTKPCNPSSALASNIIWAVSYEPKGNQDPESDFMISTTYNGEELSSSDNIYKSKMPFKEFKKALRENYLITSVTSPRKFKNMNDYCGLNMEEDNTVKYLSLALLLSLVTVVVLIMSINRFNRKYNQIREDLGIGPGEDYFKPGGKRSKNFDTANYGDFEDYAGIGSLASPSKFTKDDDDNGEEEKTLV